MAVGLGVLAAVGGLAWWIISGGAGAAVQNNAPRERTVPILVGKAERKDVPYRLDSLGTVQPLVSMSVRSRVPSQVEKVHFEDGAMVKDGDPLYTLDSRGIDAQIRQAEAQLARNRASLEKAVRDVERYIALVAKNAVAQVVLDNARTDADVLRATVRQDEANLDNLRVLRTHYDIQSPATGRIGVSAVRSGSVVNASDTAPALVTVNQIKPIYVSFGIPERYLPELRAAGDKAQVEAGPDSRLPAVGRVAVVDNTVDPTTGTIKVLGLFGNENEQLWPGSLVGVRITLRVDQNVVVIPAEAVQVGQRGTYVYVVEEGRAMVRAVKILRTGEGAAVVSEGLAGNESVVTDGQLALRDRTRVEVRPPRGT